MKSLREALADGDILICDGAMGTLLQAKGLKPGECPELWCVERRDDVRDIHRAYRDAGSHLVECNSFGGTRYKLRHYHLDTRVDEVNQAAAAVGREVAETSQYVLGSAGPTGEMVVPYGLASEEEIYEAFREQMVALEAGGADAVIIETMTALEEATAAVKAAKEHTQLVVMASFTFDPQAKGGYRTMMGVTPAQMAQAMLDAGADVIGANCGTGIDHMIEIVKAIRAAAPAATIIAMPNAGMPVVENGQTVFKQTPEQMAARAPELIAAGARIVGGCCGTTPAHIAAIRHACMGS